MSERAPFESVASTLRWIARWGPFLYAFMVVAMVFDVYISISRHADFAVIPGAVSALMINLFLFIGSLFAKPFLLERARRLDETFGSDHD